MNLLNMLMRLSLWLDNVVGTVTRLVKMHIGWSDGRHYKNC